LKNGINSCARSVINYKQNLNLKTRMKNLQELFDIYIRTKPSAEKIRAATSMMIHIGKALNVANQEEIDAEYFEDISTVLDEFFQNSPQKAILDKAILAEMIGRVGPKGGARTILDKLLEDKDANVRQYTLQTLEYYGKKYPKSVFEYIEKYRSSPDNDMSTAAAALTAKLFNTNKYENVLVQLKKWCSNEHFDFLDLVIDRIRNLYTHTDENEIQLSQAEFEQWLKKNCKKFLARSK
jgi:hypothetical protein